MQDHNQAEIAPGMIVRMTIEYLRDHPALVLILMATIFLSLGWTQDGISPDSALYASVARNIAVSGNWFNPTFTPYSMTQFAEHPPLVIWLQAIVFLLVGASDSTARIVGQLGIVGSILAVYFLAREIMGISYGFLAGLILILTYNFMQIGNSTMLDVPMTFFIITGLAGMAAVANGRRSILIPLVTGAALVGAFLCKGVVSLPLWIAFAGFTLMNWRTKWLRLRLALSAAIGAGGILLFFFLDYIYAGGHFANHYLGIQIGRGISGAGITNKAQWYSFTYRYITLYLPFIVLLPAGLYLVIKRRVILLYPTVIALSAYIICFSASPRLYLHYFCPVYALSAPLAALPLAILFSERSVRIISIWFLCLWTAAAAFVCLIGIRIHPIRMPQVYELNSKMNSFLNKGATRDGLVIGVGNSDWDFANKCFWYWKSPVRGEQNLDDAIRALKTDLRWRYISVAGKERIDSEHLHSLGMRVFAENEQLTIYVKADDSQ